MHNAPLNNLIEAILFHKAESMTRKELSKFAEVSLEEIDAAIETLSENLKGRGVTLVLKDDEVMLRTSPETSAIIEKITKDDLSKDLGKSSLETLSIILYNNPISRRDIEYIRGVKSSFILRSLLMRGLVERVPDPKDSRSHLYRPTFDTLGFLGLSQVADLPEYDKTKSELATFIAAQESDTDIE